MKTTFVAEIKEVKMRKAVSLDKVYTLRLETDDFTMMQLAAIGADETVKVTIERQGEI